MNKQIRKYRITYNDREGIFHEITMKAYSAEDAYFQFGLKIDKNYITEVEPYEEKAEENYYIIFNKDNRFYLNKSELYSGLTESTYKFKTYVGAVSKLEKIGNHPWLEIHYIFSKRTG